MRSKNLTESINHGVDGIIYAVRTERNLKIQFVVAVMVLTICLWLNLEAIDLILVFIAITFVIMAEMINTAIEAMVNLLTLSHHPLARVAKDVSAGAVIVACVNSMIIGYLVIFKLLKQPFWHSVLQRIKAFPGHAVLILFVFILILVLIIKALGRHGTFTQGGLVSGHAALAFAASTAILCITNSIRAAFLAFLLSILVAQSRVEAKFHRWIEVFLGALIGVLSSLFIFKFFSD